MLFGTGPSSGSTGPTSSIYPLYSAHLAHPSNSSAPQHQLKSFHPTALVSSMLHTTSPVNQSDLVSSLNYHHHGHHHVESVAASAPAVRVPSAGDSKSGTTSIESPGSTHRPQNSSPSSNSGGHVSGNQNEVRTVMLCSVPIVSLVMDGQERLCLAQISNTLLKTFSYNEIHNRRVALGITCVQCTPVQLELLRRAGAMPVSSRRCGMITKREAERLCKSFLAEAEPPKLPDTFSFDVYHACAWGCRGSFTPSRYNSSRAKCIKCIYCGLFFSPNKFIFHSHRLPTSKYVQPDAANFNSWRRHIKLVSSPEPLDHVSYAWEDVKAMFNGGSRKRAMSTTLNSFTKNQESKSHDKQLSAHKYKYSDENSSLEDSDEYCSLDGPPAKKQMMSPNGSSEGNTSSNLLEESSLPHPYHTFAHQMNPKGLFENHFKKAFEVSSLIGRGSQHKSTEPGKESQARSPTSPTRSCNTNSIESKSAEMMNSSSFSPIESYLESVKNGAMSKPLSTPQSVGAQSAGTYLAHPSSDQALMASYNGLLGGHHFGRQHQLTDPRMASTHPAILSTLLNGVPESHHLRSGLLPANYMQLSPPIGTPSTTSTTDLAAASLLTPNTTGSQVDFRHNIAEFMWSMAQKAGPTPYNFLWHAGSHPGPSNHQQMSNPLSVPISASHSSSSSSTPTLSPNQPQPNDTHPDQVGNGNLFGFKSPSNADEIRKALLLNSQFFHHQRNSNLSQLHPNSGMPFLPNLIGNNLRMVPSNGSSNHVMSGTSLPSNYLLAKENSDTGPSRSKSPDHLSPHAPSSIPTMSTPLFPFRSAFVAPNTAAPLDRFSSEMLAARNQFLFDAYHNATNNNSLPNSRSLFHPNMFLDKQRFEDNNNETMSDSQKSIDVIGDETENAAPTLSSLKSMYHPFTYSKNSFTGKALNGSSKYGRRNAKGEGKSSKRVASAKPRSSKKKANDNLLVLEEDSEVIQGLDSHNHVIISDGETQNGNKPTEEREEDRHISEMDRCSGNSNDETSCDIEEPSVVTCSPVANVSKQCSPMEFVSSQSPKQDSYSEFGPNSPSLPSNGSNDKMFMLLGQENGTSQPSPGNKIIKLVT